VAHADFTLNGGLKVTLTLSETSVKADGLTVVKGEVTTAEFASRPEVSPFRCDRSRARRAKLRSRAASGWPSAVPRVRGFAGGLHLEPPWPPVDVVTDANGVYDFTLTVGTTPGTFLLNAWPRTRPAS